MEIMASTSNAENLVEIARIVYQLCDYIDFRTELEYAGSGLFSQIRSHTYISWHMVTLKTQLKEKAPNDYA